jgi:hypothetical protein
MAVFAGPNVVNNGLILSFDAASRKSYNPNLVTTFGSFNYSFNNQTIPTQLDFAPDGSYVLCKHDLTGASSPFMNVRVATPISTGTYTISAWVKGTTSFSGAFAYIGETPGSSGAASTTINVTTVWQRFSFTLTITTAQTNGRVQIFFSTQGNDKIISVYGVQMVRGSDALDYYPNSGNNGNSLFDLSGRGNSGTLSNGVGYSSANAGSLVFDGVDDSIQFGGSARYFTSYVTQQITIETWVYFPSSLTWSNGFYGNIITRGNYGGSHGLFRTTVNNQISAWFRQTGAFVGGGQVESLGTITRDRWCQLVAIWKNPGSALYIDGRLASQNSTALVDVNAAATDDFWYIGLNTAASGNQGNFFNGNQANIKIYDRALSAAEVQQNYSANYGRFGI